MSAPAQGLLSLRILRLRDGSGCGEGNLVARRYVDLFIYRTVYISTYLPTYISTYLHIYLPTYLPTYLSTYLPTYILIAVCIPFNNYLSAIPTLTLTFPI